MRRAIFRSFYGRRSSRQTISNLILIASVITFFLLCTLTLFFHPPSSPPSDLSPPVASLFRRRIEDREIGDKVKANRETDNRETKDVVFNNRAIESNEIYDADEYRDAGTHGTDAGNMVCLRQLSSVLVPEVTEWRNSECQEEQYGAQTSISIILTFHDIQHLKATLVTIRKTVDIASLQDVIIVGFGNITAGVLEYLSGYTKQEVDLNIAHVLQTPENNALEARSKGADVAKGEALVFIQAGVIPSEGWLEPLVDIISNKINRVAVPRFDVLVELNTFTYMRAQRDTVPALDKSLAVSMKSVTNRNRNLLTEVSALRPEVFAVSARYFRRMGFSDAGFFEDAAFQEMALRIWRCGGRIVQSSCSNIAVYNLYKPLFVHDGTSVSKVDELWLQEGAWDPFAFRTDTLQNIERHYPKLQQMQKNLKDKHVTCSTNLNLYMKKFFNG